MIDSKALSPRLQAWLECGYEFHHGGHRLFFRSEGQGPPLLLLHGYPTASWGWHKMWPWLTEAFHVVAPDLLGSGFSDKPLEGPYTIEHLADGVEALLTHLGIRAPHVLAHAYGVTTAQELLARYLEGSGRLRLRSVCFVNGGVLPEGTRPTLTQKLLLTPLGDRICRRFPQPYVAFRRQLARNFGPRTQPSETEMWELWQVLSYKDGHKATARVLGYLKQRRSQRERWVGALEQAELPLQLINGAADPISGKAVPQLWQERICHGRLVELDPAIGQYPPLEAPAATFRALLAFHQAWRQTELG